MPIPNRTLSLALAAVLVAALPRGDIRAAPLSSAFTYQGELYDTGQPLVGSVDLRFTPFADATNPAVLGPPIVVENVVVSDGVFTAKVDFGPGFFVGDAVFLEVAVRPFDSVDPNAFEALNPRQEITAAPYTLKPAPGSVTDIELAGDAVGATQIADGAVASADIGDGSVAPQDLNLAGFDSTFWRVGGNTGAAGAALGTLDLQPLALVSPVGVTINGGRANDSTELTLRGNPGTTETNADLTLWPRNGEAFFNLSVTPTPSNAISTPANTGLFISSIGTNPFTGFQPRDRFDFDGAFSVLANNSPALPPRITATRNAIGFDVSDSSEAQELVLEDVDAQLGLYSDNSGNAGSVITLGELVGGAFNNAWGLYRATSGNGNDLRLTFGSNQAAAANPVLFHFGDNASLSLGSTPMNGETELQLTPSILNADTGVDLVMQPRGASTFFDFKVVGSDETNTSASLLFFGPGSNYEPRMRVTGTGSFGAGSAFNLAHGGSFVFADDSSATPVATTAVNQFLVRAAGGLGLTGPTNVTGTTTIVGATRVDGTLSTNATPIQSSYELSLTGATAGDDAQLALRAQGSSASYVMTADGTDTTDAQFRLTRRSVSPTPPFSTTFINRLYLAPNGFFGVNTGNGAPGFPLEVGTTAANGNGAHVTIGGVWTNGSSRTFKHAFTPIDLDDVLQRVLALPVTRWRYRGGENAWHLGPMAEDFFAAFGLGEGEKYIGTVDADGVALAAIQGLNARVEARADRLERENAALRTSLATLAERVAALERGD